MEQESRHLLLGGLAASDKNLMSEARESLRKQAKSWVTHRMDFLNIFLGNDCKVRFSSACYEADNIYMVIKFE